MSSSTPSALFFDKAKELLDALQQTQSQHVLAAADLLADALRQDRLIHVFGVSGHSAIGSEEFFWRAGGLAAVNPLFDASLMLAGGGLKSTLLERVAGVGDKVVAAAEPQTGDVLVITSIYGMNAATIDAALEAKKRGLKIVAITSREHAKNTPENFIARHPSRQNLGDLADVVIDNQVPHGDCLVQLDGLTQPLGPCSTLLVSASVQWLVIETVRACLRAGFEPAVWQSANTVGGDGSNAATLSRYVSRIKAL